MYISCAYPRYIKCFLSIPCYRTLGNNYNLKHALKFYSFAKAKNTHQDFVLEFYIMYNDLSNKVDERAVVGPR